MLMAMDGEPLVLFPSPDSRDMPIEISGDFFPRVEAFSAGILFSILVDVGSCRHVPPQRYSCGNSAILHRPCNDNFAREQR